MLNYSVAELRIMTLEDGLSGYSICVFLFMMFLVFLFVFFSNGGKLKYFFVYSIMIEEFFFSFFLRF